MFHLAVITDEISQDLDQVLAFAKQYQLEGIELRSLWEKGPFELTEADIRQIRQETAEAGLSVCGVASPFFKCSLTDSSVIEAHLEGLRRCCEYAHMLGAPLVRGFSFWKEGDTDYRRIGEQVQRAVKILEEMDMQLVLEPDPSVHTPNGQSLARLLREIDSDRVKALWDPGNIIFDDAGEIPYPDGYEAIRPWLAHLHLKDARREGGKVTAVPPGTGEVDLEGQFRRLAADGYTGWVSLEPHYRLSRELDENTLRLPGGYAISDGGYEAGVDMITRFYRLLEQWKLR